MKRSLSGGSRKGMVLDPKPEYGAQITGYIANLAKTTSPQVRLDILSKFAQLLKNKFDVNDCKPVGDILTPYGLLSLHSLSPNQGNLEFLFSKTNLIFVLLFFSIL